jgi:hypothetical protein
MTRRERASTATIRAGLYARVSTVDQTTENQLIDLRRHAEAAAGRSPSTLTPVSAARRSVAQPRIAVWRLDRFRRNIGHLIKTLDELRGLYVGFVSLGKGIDTRTPVGPNECGDPRSDCGIRAVPYHRASTLASPEPAARGSASDDGRDCSCRTTWSGQPTCPSASPPSHSRFPDRYSSWQRCPENPSAEATTFAPDSLGPGTAARLTG